MTLEEIIEFLEKNAQILNLRSEACKHAPLISDYYKTEADKYLEIAKIFKMLPTMRLKNLEKEERTWSHFSNWRKK